MFVSAIIPVYLDEKNKDEILELTSQCIQSLRGCDELILQFDKWGEGFARTVNKGLRKAKGDYIAIINNDTKMLEGSLKDLCIKGALVRPRLIEGSLAKFAFVVMDRDVIERVGYLDEDFGVGFYEDDDYLDRCIEAGIKIIQSSIRVWHKGGATISKRETEKLMEENRRLYEFKKQKRQEGKPRISILYNTNRAGGIDILYNDLIKQTEKNFEIIFVDAWKGEREKEVKEYLKDFKLVYLKGLPKKEDDVWTLNKDYNLGLKYCRGEVVVFLQDYIWIKEDTLEKIWNDYKKTGGFITSVGNKGLYPDKVSNPDGKITIFSSEFFGKPEGISYFDWRIKKFQGFKEVHFSNWEMNFALAPLRILKEIGGFDEDMDRYYGGDNIVVAAKAFKNNYKIYIDTDLEILGFNQEKLFPRPKDWEEKHSNKKYLDKKLCQIMNQK